MDSRKPPAVYGQQRGAAPPRLPETTATARPATRTEPRTRTEPHTRTEPVITSKRHRRRRGLLSAIVLRPAGLLAKTLAVLLPVLLFGAGLTYLKLRDGPISVRFLVAPIERGLNAELAGLAFDIDDAIVRLSDSGGIEFRLQNVRVREGDDIVAMAALAGVQISFDALLNGRIAPSRIDLIEPRILLTTDAEGRLGLSFAQPAPIPAAVAPAPAKASRDAPAPTLAPAVIVPDSVKRFDLARTLAEGVARLRRRDDAVSFLQTVGLRRAQVIVDTKGHQSLWRVPSLDVNLEHKQKRSIIAGSARIEADGQPWTFTFRTEESEKSRSLLLEAGIEGLVPRRLARNLPWLDALSGIDVPASGSGRLELSSEGEVLQGRFEIALGSGRLFLPSLDAASLAISGGHLEFRYAGGSQRLELMPSTVSWDNGRARIAGVLEPDAAGAWRFELNSLDGAVVADDTRTPPLLIEKGHLRGRLGPEPDRLDLEDFTLQVGGAVVAMSGGMNGARGRTRSRVEGRLGAMPLATLKALWPRGLAPRAREWAGKHLIKGELNGGSFRVEDGGAGVRRQADEGERRLSLTLEGSDLEIETAKGLPPVEAPRALLRVEGTSVEITVPEARVTTGPGRHLALRTGRLTAVEIDGERPVAELSMRLQGSLAPVLDLIEREPLALMNGTGINSAAIEGKVDGSIRLTMPLSGEVRLDDVRIEGKGRVTEGRIKNAFGPHDISGATITIDATEKAVEAKGEMLLAGVLTRLNWQRISGQPEGKQPPLRITARLDSSDRIQLGLDLEHLVQGEVPVEVTVQQSEGEAPKVVVLANLEAAELTLNDLHWLKPAGRPARLRFDVAGGRGKPMELQNFKVDGENIAIGGWVALGPDNKAKEFYFPELSLNVVTNLEVQGTLRPDYVWDVKAAGKTFDGRDLFRSFLAFGQDAKPVPKGRPGLDLKAKIETVVGAGDTTLRAVDVRLRKRAERVVALDLHATLETGKPLTASLVPEPGKANVLRAETPDAGQALKVIGLYANMIGGTGTLEINLDGRGEVERQGQLVVHNFRVLGDPIVSEVLQNAESGRPAISAGATHSRRVVREQFDFERMRAPFSIGSGQLVIDTAQITGALVGATLRGKIDFKARHVDVGGTYVPLSGLNRALGFIPILGPLVIGPRGEGVLGITYSIEGPLSAPQVMANPLALVAPGIFREIFQMAPENPRVTPRIQPKTVKSGGPRVRASDPEQLQGEAGAVPKIDPEVIGGWSSETMPAKGAKKKQ